MSLAPELIARIREHGPITVADYMARAGSYYYATRDPFGVQGDFTTSPEISQLFGELTGAWVADCWQRAGKKRALLVELGPGRGTLMKDFLRATRPVKEFHDAIDIRLVETSPTLRDMQKRTLQDAHPRIAWHETLEDMPALPLLLIANEFFDALPVEQYALTEKGWVERRVDYAGGAFTFLPGGDGFIREESPASLLIMTHIAAHIRRFGGAALIVDYGYHLPEGNGNGPTLQALRSHSQVSALENPGEADITAHVNFAALGRAASDAGAHVHGPVEQGTFLKRLGAELRATALCKGATPRQRDDILSGLERLVAPHQMGTLFKVMAVTKAVDSPAGF